MGKKSEKEGNSRPADPETEEKKSLRSLAFSEKLLRHASSKPSTPLEPSKSVLKLKGCNVIKWGQQKSRYLFSFPSLLAPLSGGCIDELADLSTAIKPLLDFLLSLSLPRQIITRMLEKRPYVLGYDLHETVKPNVDALLSFEVHRETLPSVIIQYPPILGLPLKAKLLASLPMTSFTLPKTPDLLSSLLRTIDVDATTPFMAAPLRPQPQPPSPSKAPGFWGRRMSPLFWHGEEEQKTK